MEYLKPKTFKEAKLFLQRCRMSNSHLLLNSRKNKLDAIELKKRCRTLLAEKRDLEAKLESKSKVLTIQTNYIKMLRSSYNKIKKKLKRLRKNWLIRLFT